MGMNYDRLEQLLASVGTPGMEGGTRTSLRVMQLRSPSPGARVL